METQSVIKESPFLKKPELWLYENKWAFVFDCGHPLSKGHVLICPKREVSDPFLMNAEEWQACHELLAVVRDEWERKYEPKGYNIGWNAGPAAGQTVMHCHMHVIPRYAGDHPKPRGGLCKNLLPEVPEYYK